MKRIFLLAAAAVLLSGGTADAGPLRNLAGRVRTRIAERPVIQRLAGGVRQIASVPARVVERRPVASFIQAVATAPALARGPAFGGSCPGGVCPPNR